MKIKKKLLKYEICAGTEHLHQKIKFIPEQELFFIQNFICYKPSSSVFIREKRLIQKRFILLEKSSFS
jgi:hypothetical protein